MDVLAIDLGTSGVKVAVIGDRGATKGSASRPLVTSHAEPGAAEQDAEEWWEAIGACSRAAVEAAGDPRRIGAVAITSQYMSTVAVDGHGLPLSPVMTWMDHRGGPLHPRLHDWDAFMVWLERHGLPPMSNDGIAHIAWLRGRDPSLVDRGAVFVEPVDAVVARLTGRVTATQNSAFGLMTIDNRTHGRLEFDPELLALAGVDRAWLPQLVPMDEPVGTILPGAAEHLGVPPSTIVLPGTIDSITSAVGTGAIGPESIAVVIGTTAVIVSHVAAKQADLDHAITSVPSPVADRYFVMAENGVGGKALDQVLRTIVYGDDALSLGPMPVDAFERAEAVAATAAPGCGGVMFLPWLVGSMSPAPDDDIRGGFVNVGLTTTRADLVRAVYEGVAANAAWLFPAVREFTGRDHASVRFGGGAARSDLWASILADALGVAVEQLDDAANTNARGAALLALVQLGELDLDAVPGLVPVRRTHVPDAARHAGAVARTERLVEFHGLTRAFHGALPHP